MAHVLPFPQRPAEPSPIALALWLDELASLLPYQPERIVELGCGAGAFCRALSQGWAARVIGVEGSEAALSAARAAGEGRELDYRVGSAQMVPVESGWADLILVSLPGRAIVDPAGLVEEVRRVLRPRAALALRQATREPSPLEALIDPLRDAGFTSLGQAATPDPTGPGVLELAAFRAP